MEHKHVLVEGRAPAVDFASNGLQVSKPLKQRVIKVPTGYKRPPMDGRFSRFSALNLRRKLACLPAETFRLWAATLTIPSQCYRGVAEFRRLWFNFCGDVTLRLRGVQGGGTLTIWVSCGVWK